MRFFYGFLNEKFIFIPFTGHDLVSDSSLQFRPTTSRQKRQANDNYWYAIKQELERGCTCLIVDTKYRYHLHDCTCTREEKETILPYSTIRFSGPSTSCPENVYVIRTPSRIPLLIEELREILLSVTAPSKVSVRGSCLKCLCSQNFVPRSAGGDESWLVDALDVALIEQELKHGVFNFSGLLVAVGAMLGRYCSPARDTAIKAMVGIVQKSAESSEKILNVVNAIRMCFEIVEMMKLVSTTVVLPCDLLIATDTGYSKSSIADSSASSCRDCPSVRAHDFQESNDSHDDYTTLAQRRIHRT